MKNILSFLIIGALYIFNASGQITFKMSGFPKNTIYRIEVVSPGGKSEFNTRGDTSFLIKGHKPITKIYIHKNGLFPINVYFSEN